MYIFMLFVLVSLILILALKYTEKKNRLNIIFLVTFFFIFLFRFSIGPDTTSYMWFFERVENPILDSLTYVGQRNMGFNILLYLSKSLSENYQIFILLFNFIVLTLCSYVIYKNSNNILLSILLFVGSGILEIYYSSALRQMIAMAIFFYAYFIFIKQKKYLPYNLLILLACLFHETAFIGFIVPILSTIQNKIQKNEKKIAIYVFIISILLAITISPIMQYVSNNFDLPTNVMHIVNYFSGSNFSIVGVGYRFVSTSIILYMYISSQKDNNDNFMQLQVYTIVASFAIYLILCNFSVFSRFSDFIEIIMLITIPNLIYTIPSIKKKYIALIPTIILNLVLLYSDVDFKIDMITGIENSSVLDYKYYRLFSSETNNYIEIVWPKESPF